MRLARPPVLVASGGLLYVLLEYAFRGRSHWTMAVVGGLCFWLVGLVNEVFPWDMPFISQCVAGAAAITAVEFVSGCIINLWLGWDVWDYSGMPLNLMGQVCLPFSLLWVAVSAAAVVLDDFLRWKLFGEEKPRYRLW